MFDLFKHHRRSALRKKPLSPVERALIEKSVPYVARLSGADREELGGLIQIFLDEKAFEGCGGLEVTEEMKVTIAAQACILLLHRETDIYPGVDAILVYPAAYVAPLQVTEGGIVTGGPQGRLGESSMRGTVVLAWDHVRAAALHPLDGENVVLHEFAHQLDGETGAMNGTPDLGARGRYTSWGHVLGDEFDELSKRVHDGSRGDIDPYGATNAAEFFAVVTEMFFARSQEMKQLHPALYGELATFYRQDPAAL